MKQLLIIGLAAMAMPTALSAQEAVAVQEAATDIALDEKDAAGMLSFADITLQFQGKPPKGTDRVIYLMKREDGEILLSGIAVVDSDKPTTKSEDALGTIRMRYTMPKEPLAEDAAFVSEHGQSLIVIDATKNRRWEIGRVGGETQYRALKSNGSSGDWKEF